MNYTNKQISTALNVINSRRQSAEKSASERHDEFAKQHPELLIIEQEMSNTGLAAVKAMNDCKDPRKVISQLKEKNLGYQKARRDLLALCGLDENYLKPNYTCKKCSDTGFCNGEICDCLDEILKKDAFKSLADSSPLKISKFEDFDPSLQSDNFSRDKTSKIYNFCKEYADDFSIDSPSLFFYGNTGLGKTHLSLAIAGKVIDKGYGVVYGSAQTLFNLLEREHFGRSADPDGTTEDKLMSCDLLILDDLGAEFTTQFTVAALYNIINTRMAKELPTIINSNVPIEELENRYSERITSRIIGTYQTVQFVGKDVRQLKLF